MELVTIDAIVSSHPASLLQSQAKLEGLTAQVNMVYSLNNNVYLVDRITGGVISPYNQEDQIASKYVGMWVRTVIDI